MISGGAAESNRRMELSSSANAGASPTVKA
jgi:hypothetical protein